MSCFSNVKKSHAELDRFGVITRVRERRLPQVEVARILDLGVRQVQRLCAAVAQDGADGLISRKRGRPSSRRSMFRVNAGAQIIPAVGERVGAAPGDRALVPASVPE
jgi:hypothetical protein